MKKLFVAALMSAAALAAQAKDIVDTAVAAGQFKTLATALQAAGLVDTLKGKGPFTVFAPTDAAFAKLPAGTLETLLKPENRDQLTKILTSHVVPGQYNAAAILQLINQGGGEAKLTTAEGSQLTAKLQDGKVVVVDENGGVATVIQADLLQSNGVIHVVNSVLMPAS